MRQNRNIISISTKLVEIENPASPPPRFEQRRPEFVVVFSLPPLAGGEPERGVPSFFQASPFCLAPLTAFRHVFQT
jgi:hypothetical protein